MYKKYIRKNIQQQAESLKRLLEQLGEASPTEIKAILEQREKVEPEPELKPEVIEKIRQLIKEKEQFENDS
ncbi:hypothetical protein PCC7424_4297 [Gloeothece citriformis PCC 7424]|uniref:Uncharacterized protein n=1 Tax=Gloeothece citriformis (strain PCC 7424) TaxID=65393 RepID=B7K6W6_GLOC7|nr:hypothetical protein [Gloeothece citriformis]ACK72665.1 hypothetical protein PCC7424_4297 [Gloeothece citriformis PCC 7424]